MKRNLLFIVAIALAVPYMTALADGDVFDAAPADRPQADTSRAPNRAADCRELCDTAGGGPTHEEWPGKNVARLPDDKNSNQDERQWQYDRD